MRDVPVRLLALSDRLLALPTGQKGIARIKMANNGWQLKERKAKLMKVTIEVPSEAEQKLRAAAARRGQTLEAYLGRGQTLEAYLEWLAIVSVGNGSGPPRDQTAEEWVAAWRAFVDSHASNPNVADDSRESIYGDRGL